jgi:XTP/dITP diphosphohydrolase
MTRKVVLASGNKGKLKEFGEILQPMGMEIVAQGTLGVADADETGLTFVENAILKARNACEHTGFAAISDDSGLEVDYLQGAPGIYSSRYAGAGATDATNIEKLLQALKGVPAQQRTARFRCILVCMRHQLDPTPLICMGSWEGLILDAPRGEHGFGYDPIFWSPEFDKASAELTPTEKKSVSHRGKAVSMLTEQIAEFLK